VEFGTVFPSGAYAAGAVEKVRDFDKSRGDRVIQQSDKATGLPVWVIEVIDADPEARQRTVKVKIVAQVQPVLPDAPAGSPFTPVEFDGMTATPWVDASRCTGDGDGKHKCRPPGPPPPSPRRTARGPRTPSSLRAHAAHWDTSWLLA
jgi:hypothetical protein